MRKKCRFAGLFLASFSVFALAGCGNNNNGFTVTFNSNGGSSVEPFISYDGKVMEPTEPTKDGSTFAGWFEDEALTDEFLFDSEIVNGDTTLYAKWDDNTAKVVVTFDSMEGSPVTSQEFKSGEKAIKPTDPTKTGYKFGGWYTDNEFKNEFDFDTTVTESITLYANWETYTVADLIELSKNYVENPSTERFYTYVTIKEVSKPEYGEMTVFDDTGEILVYGTRGSDGKTYYEDLEDKPYAGDDILLYANVQEFKGTPEIQQGWIMEVHHNEDEFDITDYTEKSISEAREEDKGAKVQVEGVVAQFTYNASQSRTGFILVDDTSSIYVYDDQIAMQVEKGNKVKIAATRDNWILEDEQSSAGKWGYDGCIQLTDAHIVSNDKGENGWDRSWVKENTVKGLMEADPKDKNITTEIYKVNALIQEKPGSGFTNYYFFDLDGETGSYAYSQASGADFEWLRQFDGKICTVYLMVLNYKSAASGINARFLPIDVIDEGFEFNQEDGAQFVLDYYVSDKFDTDTYYADPNLEVPTTVSNNLIGIKDAKVTYTSDDETVIKFNEVEGKTYMNVLSFANKSVKITAEATYAGNTAKFEKTINVKDLESFNYSNVKTAIDAEVDTQVSVRAIVGPSLVNRDGFYLIDDTGVIAVTTDEVTLGTLKVGDEVILHGTRTQFKADAAANKPGQSCILDAVIDVNLYGENEYSTKTFRSDKTFEDLMELDYTQDFTNDVYYVKAKVEVTETPYYTSMKFVDPANSENTLKLYSASANQYSFLFDYADKELTYAIAPCNWNLKDYYAFCVLNVQLEDGTIINNTLNFNY